MITREDIRHSPARRLAELLRHVPGVDLARVNASQWAVGIRGFTSGLARAQLVLIDGRSVYSPLFAGTYWDVQDMPLDDIERIEVIRGPGGTLWGANAVNGVINIITKSAKDTLGGLLTGGAGDEERGFGGVRYGGKLGQGGAYRIYGTYFDREPEFHRTTGDFDGWHMYRGGFRSDWDLNASDTLTVQGNLYQGKAGQRTSIATYEPPFTRTVEQRADLGGGNLLARWKRSFGPRGELSLQTYYDRTHRAEANFQEDRDTFDFDVQYHVPAPARQDIVVGLGYRLSDGRTAGAPVVVFRPPERTDHIVTAFVEDTFALVPDRLLVTVGSKFEKNEYTGLEIQPSLRVGWTPREGQFAWGALSRGVRTPSRVERDLMLDAAVSPGQPIFARILGDDGFESEHLLALEGGYRFRLADRVSADVALFHNRYSNLLSYQTGASFAEPGRLVFPFRATNGLEGKASGVELTAELRPAKRWLLRTGYDYLNVALAPKAGSTDPTSAAAAEDASPRHRVFAWSSVSVGGWLNLDAWYRWVARRPQQRVAAYSELNVRVGGRPLPRLELAVVGQNVLHPRHVEFGGVTEIQRSLYAVAALRF